LYQFDEIFKRSNQVVEEYSVNQTRGGIKTIPIFLDIKVKKLDNRDPLIQAAIWCAAGIKKKLRAGWTTELPCPIILVKEDTWLLYIGVYQDGDTLVSFLRDKIGVLLIKGSISPDLGKSDLQ
jgi:hypothetical protein